MCVCLARGHAVVLAETNADVLLHLSALVVAITIAYIGLDQIRWEPDVFEARLDAAETQAEGLVARTDVRKNKIPDRSARFYKFPFLIRIKFYVLCHVARAKIKMGAMRIFHIFYRQRHVPLLGYFRKRADRKCVMILGAIALLLFLYGTADSAFELRWISEEAWAVYSFWISVVILFWVILTALVSHMLLDIQDRCDQLYNCIEEHAKKVVDDETGGL
jgi:hypothetical protein